MRLSKQADAGMAVELICIQRPHSISVPVSIQHNPFLPSFVESKMQVGFGV